MRRTGDQALVKEINTTIVLDTIISHQPISRAEISALTGLNKGTVSSLVQELIERNLVSETGTGKSSGGRKPVMLQFRQNSGYAIGVELGVNFIHTILCDLSGHVLREHMLPRRSTDQQTVFSQLLGSIEHIVAALPECYYGLIGVGIGIPGIVNSDGLILFAPNLGWENIPLRQWLEEQLSVPVHVDNEANAGAVGEQQFGSDPHTSDMIYISAGIGIGAGIIMNNEIYRGSSGFSGEIGHLTIDSDGRVCRCGNRGCWELYASENALLAKASSSLQDIIEGGVTLEQIADLAEAGHPDILKALEQIGRYLGIGVAGIINTFNPKLIIIGNRLTHVASWLEHGMMEEIRTRALAFHQQAVRVTFSNLGTRSTSLGAAYMAISDFLRQVNSTEKN